MTASKYMIRPAGECVWATVYGWRKALDEYRKTRRWVGLNSTTVYILDKDGNDITEELKDKEFETDYNKW